MSSRGLDPAPPPGPSPAAASAPPRGTNGTEPGGPEPGGPEPEPEPREKGIPALAPEASRAVEASASMDGRILALGVGLWVVRF